MKKTKLPFLNKISSSSFPSNSLSSSSSWPWPSCHQQTPKTVPSSASFMSNKPNIFEVSEPSLRTFSSSTSHDMDNPMEIESIDSIIKELSSSKRLIFDGSGRSNSILEVVSTREDHDDEEEGFMLLSLESNDPYSDFKNSMEKMVEANAMYHNWRSLEKLLFWFLKVNVKTSHRYIFDAFVDLLLNLAVGLSKDVAGEPSPNVVVVEESPSSSSPISSYRSFMSSDETSSTSVRFLPETSIGEKSLDVCCLASLFELEEKIKDNIDSDGYVSS